MTRMRLAMMATLALSPAENGREAEVARAQDR